MPYDIIIGRDESDKKRFGDKGLIYLGKGFVKMGQYTSLSNPIYMDVARSHVVLVAGKRGAGKSYSLGIIAEELTSLPPEESKNIAGLIFDTMGIFWTMKYANEKDSELLEEWKLKPKTIPLRVFVPFGFFEDYTKRGLPVDFKFSINPSEIEAQDWILTFGLGIVDPIAILIERILTKLKEEKPSFEISEIIEAIKKDTASSQEIKNSATGLFEAAESWKVFSAKEGTQISQLVEGGKTSVLDLSMYSSTGAFNVRAMVIAIISRKLFNERMMARKKEEIQAIQHGTDYLAFKQEREMPLVWIFVDECLTGNTEIVTDKEHTQIQEVIRKFENGENIKVLGFDTKSNLYGNFEVKEVYKKGKRKVVEIITETGKKLRCTPEHRVLTKKGFFSAFSVDEIGSPLIQHYSTNEDCIRARILGHLFGDGWTSKKRQELGFSGKKEDLKKIKNDLLSLGLRSSNIFSRETNSKIKDAKGKEAIVNGITNSFTASYNAFRRFENLEIPLGRKTEIATKIPSWIKEGDKKVKMEFLASLMGSEGSKMSKAKNAKGDFNAIRFSFNKVDGLEKEAFDFAYELKELFESLGVKISNISKKEGNIRKDCKKTIKIVITLKKDTENIIRFLERIGYKYCSEKELEGNKWLAYLKVRLFLKKEREKIYEKALELHKKGLGKVKISRELNFPEARIRDWIYNKIKPGLPKEFPDIDKWLEKRLEGDVLFERVFRLEDAGEEEVYDISVDQVHNFVSNGLITHNCHEFIPNEGKTAATDALVQLLREGRQPGISLVMATQQPGGLAKDAITQADIVISHRVTAMPDIKALNEMMQSYLFESIKRYFDELPALKGSAIILDDNSERIYPMRVRPRFTWHGGEAPTAVKIERRI